ncbi:leucine-rich repeat-containing protein 72 isoform X1 [Meleagris gallopavo]|uniref:Leucine rich repeat containing 72 n=1 Tax=Meleagris gallopavo TaxID=9103 RepID=A0A803XWZ1_MELGA|nr:leucine-rich repeat-containing protein 72 isoform X1 [Meleagris gallopavo]XP_031409777.1 leucine-rich repeat-containing protein 72 isoform X1 [Meleagris gallopavo]XP_031409778.1 leucine-rich repeat-containing protein 72 isoform X1 [Meleagris gallopavo]
MAVELGFSILEAVEKQLKICGFKRNVDVLVLYLAGQGLRSIPSLSLFHRLRYLWINNNKIQDLSFLEKNCCLTELYLNNNELTDISGALKNLHSLQILLLHNNQLKQLGETVKELKGMISLRTLNLFYNPLAYDAGYRLYVIHSLPSVQLLDRKPVTQRERELAFSVYNRERSSAVESIVFGKSVDTLPGTAIRHSRGPRPARRLMVPPGWEFGNHTNKVPFENPEDAVLLRAMARSIMEFSSIDWNKVPTCQERRLKHKAKESPEKLTIQFR